MTFFDSIAQKSEELPEPYSNTVLSLKSRNFKNSIAGYVYQGKGRLCASRQADFRIELN
jgi:hypothetical protein